MKRTILVTLTLAAACLLAVEPLTIRPVPSSLPVVERKGETVVKDDWDWAKEMIPVAKKFTGKQGRIILIGDYNCLI